MLLKMLQLSSNLHVTQENLEASTNLLPLGSPIGCFLSSRRALTVGCVLAFEVSVFAFRVSLTPEE
jgi:hypothetical protein